MRPDEALAQPVHRPDERHDELVHRRVVQLARRADLLDPALVEEHDLARDLHRLLLVVRDDDRRHVHLVVEAPQPGPELLAHARVERTEGLVEQEHARLDRKGAGERHPLALASGKLGRIALREPVELDELEQLVHAIADLGARPLADGQPEGDVVVHRHVLERGVVLEDHSDPTGACRLLGDVFRPDQHLARIRPLEPRDHAQQRRLAASTRPEQRRERALGNRDRDIVQRRETVEPLGDVDDRDPAHRAPSSLGCRARRPTTTTTAISASTTDDAYAPAVSNPSN